MIVTGWRWRRSAPSAVPINVASRAPQISYIAANSRATSFIVGSECLPLIDQIETGLERIERVVLLNSDVPIAMPGSSTAARR